MERGPLSSSPSKKIAPLSPTPNSRNKITRSGRDRPPLSKRGKEGVGGFPAAFRFERSSMGRMGRRRGPLFLGAARLSPIVFEILVYSLLWFQ